MISTRHIHRIAIALSLCMLLSMLAACTPASQSPDPAGATPTAAPAAGDTPGAQQSGEKTRFSIGWWAQGSHSDDSLIERKLEERFTDIDFQFIPYERSSFPEQFKTRAAGGDIADFFLSPYDNYGMISQGVAAAFDLSMIQENMPNYYQAMIEFNEAYNCQVFAQTYYEGKYYGLPLVEVLSITPFVNAYRSDWMEKVGVTQAPTTIDELEELLVKFTNEDPDGNGQNDTYGLMRNGKEGLNMAWQAVPFAYGATHLGGSVIKDGKVVDAMRTDEMRDALATLHKWYDMGLIDPEFITMDSATLNARIADNKVGYLSEGWYHLMDVSPRGEAGKFYTAIQEKTPGASWVFGPAVTAGTGYSGFGHWGPTPGNVFMFGKQLENEPERLQKIMQTLEAMLTEPDLVEMLWYGVEGETFEVGEDGIKRFLPQYQDVDSRKDTGLNMTHLFMSATPESLVNTAIFRSGEDIDNALALAGNINTPILQGSGITHAPADAESQQRLADATTAVAQVRSQWFIDFIIGEKSLDQWDEFIEDWKAAGGEMYEENLNAIYQKDQGVLQAVSQDIK